MGSEVKYVWPWTGILANVPTQIDKTGWRIGGSCAKLRDDLIAKGFNVSKVESIWDYKGHSGFVVVEFNREVQVFENIMRFERSFVLDRHGKKDWENNVHMRDDKLYGWAAREDDYNRSDAVGKRLRKKGDLKTVSQLEAEDKRKTDQLVENMYKTIETNKKCTQELEQKVLETSSVLEKMMLDIYWLNKIHEEGIEATNMKMKAFYLQILQEHEQSMAELDAEKEKLEERARKNEQQAKINEEEMEKLRRKIEKNQNALWIHNEVEDEAAKLALKHKKEMENLHEKIRDRKAKLNEKLELELQLEILKGSANLKETEIQREIEARETVLQNKLVTLTLKERQTNDEYQKVRQAMIMFWNSNEESVREENIRVKRMGQLHLDPFLAAVMKQGRCSNSSRAETEAMHLCSVWERDIGDVQWYPFKIDASDGTPKRVVDESDHKLSMLKNEYGEEVFDEVVRAKREMEDYNASGGYVFNELWNYEADRKATLEEATDVMSKIWSASKMNKRMRL